MDPRSKIAMDRRPKINYFTTNYQIIIDLEIDKISCVTDSKLTTIWNLDVDNSLSVTSFKKPFEQFESHQFCCNLKVDLL